MLFIAGCTVHGGRGLREIFNVEMVLVRLGRVRQYAAECGALDDEGRDGDHERDSHDRREHHLSQGSEAQRSEDAPAPPKAEGYVRAYPGAGIPKAEP